MTNSEQNGNVVIATNNNMGNPISLLVHGGQKMQAQREKIEDIDCESKKCPSCKDTLPIHRFLRKDRPSAPPCKTCQYCREKANSSLTEFRQKEKERFLNGEMTEEQKIAYLRKKLINSKQSSDARKKRIRKYKEQKLTKRARKCIEVNRHNTKLKYEQTKEMRERHKRFWQALDNHIDGEGAVYKSFISDGLPSGKSETQIDDKVSVPSFRVERYYKNHDDIIIIVQSRGRNGILCELDYVRCKYLIDRYEPAILTIVGKSFDGEADAKRLSASILSTLEEGGRKKNTLTTTCICFKVHTDEHASVYRKNNGLQDNAFISVAGVVMQ